MVSEAIPRSGPRTYRSAGRVVDTQRGRGISLRIQIETGRSDRRAPAPAAMFTVVVVLPTPPFWLATTNTRGRSAWAESTLKPRLRLDEMPEPGAGVSAISPESNSSRSNLARRGPGGLDTGALGGAGAPASRAGVSRETSAWLGPTGAEGERTRRAGDSHVGRTAGLRVVQMPAWTNLFHVERVPAAGVTPPVRGGPLRLGRSESTRAQRRRRSA